MAHDINSRFRVILLTKVMFLLLLLFLSLTMADDQEDILYSEDYPNEGMDRLMADDIKKLKCKVRPDNIKVHNGWFFNGDYCIQAWDSQFFGFGSSLECKSTCLYG